MSTDAADGGVTQLVLTVPIAVETEKQAQERMDLAGQLGLQPDQVPTARRDSTDLEIQWTLVNGTDKLAIAKLAVIAANEYFRYDPAAFVTDPQENAPPPLAGGKPIMVPAMAQVSGLIREDELAEAAQDLDAFTRGGVIAQKALITRWKTGDVTGGMGGMLDTIPSAAIPLLLELDLSAEADQPLTLTATLRVRDRSGRLRPTEMDASALVPASGTVYTPPAPTP
jgi:hypothetical protein